MNSMSNLFRFNILRPVQELPEEKQEQVGLQTHAENSSEWSADILGLCAANDHEELYTEVLTYLSGSTALENYVQLSPTLNSVIAYLRKKGRTIDAADFNFTFRSNTVDPYFTTAVYGPEKQLIEDTILALAIVGKLGNRGNINYILAYKATQLLKASYDNGSAIPQADLTMIMAKPVIIPYCRYNKCTKKYEPNIRFAHLDLENTVPPPVDPQLPQEPCECAECTCETDCNCPGKCCAEIKPYVADLMVVREDLTCYRPAHLAYIENVMVGESRERVHRNLDRTETFSETETETTKSLEKDHQVEDRFSLKSEITKTLEQDIGIDAGITTTTDFGNTVLDTNFNFSYDLSKSESQHIAQEYARNVVTKSLSKIEETVRQLNSIRRTIETEETNTHSFNNVGGPKHIVGQYHFVNMINRAQVMNYGKRLMFEFVLPEPMELYKALIAKTVGPFNLKQPTKPPLRIDQVNPGPLKPDMVTPTDPYSDNENTDLIGTLGLYLPAGLFNYLDLIKFYGLTGVDPMPDVDIRIPFSFDQPKKIEGENVTTYTVTIANVPADYNARGFKVEMKSLNPTDNTSPDVEWFIDGVHSGSFNGFNTQEFFSPPVDAAPESTITMSVMAKSSMGTAGSGYVLCQLTAQAQTKWKTSVWEKIMAKYQQDLEEYETALARYEQEKKAKLPFGNNPFINREIERTELKRAAISYISCQFYDQFTAMKRNTSPCGFPEMNLEQAQNDGEFVQFFEQLFQWNLMTYLFYPYFWGQKCSWAEKVQTNSGDPLFDKALSAGAARVQVPVRPGHEALAMHWVAYGEIWQGQSDPPVPNSDYYVSMAQELKEQKNHFYTDRPGTLTVTPGEDWVALTGTDHYYLDPLAIEADIDREIMINCEVYRVVKIVEGAYNGTTYTPDADHMEWTIHLERAYVGEGCCGCDTPPTASVPNIKYSMGALFVGAPFEVTVPTNLVFLRNTVDPATGMYTIPDCLPCYPIDSCQSS